MSKITPGIRYVNDMFNIGYLTGFVREIDQAARTFRLMQSNNLDQALLVRVPSNMRIPADKTPVTVIAHVFGAQNDASGEQELQINAIDIQKPSLRAMPALTTWRKGMKGGNDPENFRPFSSGKGLRPVLAQEAVTELAETEGAEFTTDEQIMRDILEATRGRLDTRLTDNSNVVNIAGVVDSMAWVNPNEHQGHNGYGLIMLRQHEDQTRNIPVRLVTPQARAVMKAVSVGLPVFLSGQVRRKTVPDDANPGEKRSSCYLMVKDVHPVSPEKDIKRMPAWWSSIRDRLQEDLRARREAAIAKQVATTGLEGL